MRPNPALHVCSKEVSWSHYRCYVNQFNVGGSDKFSIKRVDCDE